ncbi:DUF2867 domain-containing protein [Streptomyces sp. WAC05374]|uniref:DUF2867 domain-containing protein n=1 Tax=Streptomyces sp. WAC05374 TaxID=2487420 RepID=UPI000F8611A7|nr:DUF2867 domain-containing protein [Streptomyces sp. WAC05374]RST10273.1 DUF2867 domain-containing protein [Streptomyces sp. WAC05374]TDF50317.1 DUF2867 domain-containing protein [Streptomyces sp. WAC05374]TDF58041.1 DUF2867 domain-containing protein [Streptomyces sp. WAC05374]TDF60569.1 DUF2867 domain-containing protein [Streptomyces sp. WAC05374]
MRTVRNVHARVIEAPAEQVGALLDRIAGDDDPLFPTPAWTPVRFDRPLGVGADGGHGGVRYRVTAYTPGRGIRFDFAPPSTGHHRLDVEPLGPGRCRLVHTLEERQGPGQALLWSLFIRPLHDSVIEELLDNAERATSGTTAGRPVTRSPWVRLLHRLEHARPAATPVPAAARLARAAFDRPDFTDAWRMPLAPGMDRDPRAWRGVLPFPVNAVEGGELLLGQDAAHLDFRASLLVEDHSVTLSTVVRTHNRLGRLYFGAVRHVHPYMARMMLRRTYRRIALAAPTAGERHWAREAARR